MSDWFNTGKEAVDKAYQKKTFFSDRFFLKDGAEAVIAFLDGDNTPEEPIGNFREHQFNTLDGQFSNFCSCVGGGNCLLCEKGLQPYDAWPFSIVQLRTSFLAKDQKPIPIGRKLMISKKEAVQKILRYVAQKQGLAGSIWTVYRTSKTAYTIGDDWQFIAKIGTDGMTPSQRREEMKKAIPLKLQSLQDPKRAEDATFTIPAECLSPINYREILKPKTKDELQAMGVDWAKSKAWQEEGKSKFAKKDGGGAAPRGSSASVQY